MGVLSIEKDPGPEIEPVKRKVIGVDLDDSTFWREVGTRYIGHAKDLLLRPSLPKAYLDDLSYLKQIPSDSLSLKEKISLVFHSRRTAIPGMAEMLREEVADGTLVYGVSGRRDSRPWQEMTAGQLIRENIPLTDFYLTPKGISSLENKDKRIKELGITHFYEDNKRTACYLARENPDVQIIFIDHGLDHFTEEEQQNYRNIEVKSILDICRAKPSSEEKSGVRNSDLRKKTDFINPAVEAFHGIFPGVKAWHVTAAGVAFSIAGVELAEHQNRTNKYYPKTTALAVGFSLVGATLDLLDGKLARHIRNGMIDEKVKAKDEEKGQAMDPFADGIIEAWQGGSSAYTAWKKGNRTAAGIALLRMATTNLPRTAKAIAGCFGFPVPETYRIKDVLRGDIRFFGTSLGRKIPNYLSSFVNTAGDVPVQAVSDSIATVANGIVTAERLSTLATPKGELTLSDKEIRHAKVRASVLGIESLAFTGAAYYLGKKFLSKGNGHKK